MAACDLLSWVLAAVPASALGIVQSSAAREKSLRELEIREAKHMGMITLAKCEPGSTMEKEFLLAKSRHPSVKAEDFTICLGASALGPSDCDEALEALVGKPCSMPADFEPLVEVRASGSRGLGVFATRDIAIGEIATYYAGHVRKLADFGMVDYGAGLFDSNRYTLKGDPLSVHPKACGQLINDPWAFGATPEEADKLWELPGLGNAAAEDSP